MHAALQWGSQGPAHLTVWGAEHTHVSLMIHLGAYTHMNHVRSIIRSARLAVNPCPADRERGAGLDSLLRYFSLRAACTWNETRGTSTSARATSWDASSRQWSGRRSRSSRQERGGERGRKFKCQRRHLEVACAGGDHRRACAPRAGPGLDAGRPDPPGPPGGTRAPRRGRVSGHDFPGGSSSAGRAAAFQAACRGFETRLPLHFFPSPVLGSVMPVSGVHELAGQRHGQPVWCD